MVTRFTNFILGGLAGILLLSFFSFGEEQGMRIAVSDLSPKGVDSSFAAIVTERIRSELVSTRLFRVMERTEMKSILDEQRFQRTDLCDQTCAIEMGQILGVGYIVAGSIGKIGKVFTITTRMINVNSGEIICVSNEDCRCPIENVLQESPLNISKKFVKCAKEMDSFKKPHPAENRIDPQKQKIRIRYIRTTVIGVSSIALAVAGVYMNSLASERLGKQNATFAQYQNAPSGSDFASLKSSYDAQRKETDKDILLRNVLYGISGLCAVGFVISFTF